MAKKPEAAEAMIDAIDVGAIEAAPQAATTAVATIASFEDELAQYAVEAAESESIVGTFLSFKGGRLSIADNPVAGNKLDCIIVASINENAYYPGKYNPDSPQPPVCFAFGNDEADMAPHEDSPKPQHTSCLGCPMNEWKSDPNSDGKACKNVRRLALVAADVVNDPSKILGAEQIYAKLPVTSVKEWAKYVHGVATEFKRPPFAVVTTITAEPDPKTQFKVKFTAKERVQIGEATVQLIALHKAAEKTIGFPYQAMTEPVADKNAKF